MAIFKTLTSSRIRSLDQFFGQPPWHAGRHRGTLMSQVPPNGETVSQSGPDDPRGELTEREAARAKVLRNPLRYQMHVILAERPATPKELADELDISLHRAMYHVRVLAGNDRSNDFPFIKEVGTDRKRGGTQHIYEAVVPPIIGVEEAARLDRPTREKESAFVTSLVIEDLERSLGEGLMDIDEQRTLFRYHDLMDRPGLLRLAHLVMEFLAIQQEVSAEAKERIARGETEGFALAMDTLMFRVSEPYHGKESTT